MVDGQIPDLSNIGMPEDLPAPRTAVPARVQAQPEIQAQTPTSPNQQRRHTSSIQDMQRLAAESTVPPKGSIMTQDDLAAIDAAAHGKQPPGGMMHQTSAPTPVGMPTEENPLVGVPNQKIRDIRELFTFGKLHRKKVIAGFEIEFKTLSTDDYTKAWTMAAMFPEGTARDYVIMQYLLAHSITSINGYAAEVFCKKPEITDPIARKVFVFGNLDRNLIQQFFDEGYATLNRESQEIIRDLQKTQGDVAAFFPGTQKSP